VPKSDTDPFEEPKPDTLQLQEGPENMTTKGAPIAGVPTKILSYTKGHMPLTGVPGSN